MSEHEEAVDVDEIARILHVSRDTIYARARAGEIPAFKVGRVWRFWPSEVREALRPKPVDLWAQPPGSAAGRYREARKRLAAGRGDAHDRETVRRYLS